MADPVLWLKTDKPYEGRFRRARVWNEKTKQWDTPVYEKGHPKAGRPVMEKMPGIGFDGEPTRAVQMKTKRFIEVLRTDGNIVFVPITNAAAHKPQEDRSCEADRRLKAQYFSWIPVGSCPAILLATGTLRPENVEADHKKWTACHPGDIGEGKPPCQHFTAEMNARRARRNDETNATEEKYASDVAKHTAALEKMADRMVTAAERMAMLNGQATGGGGK